MTLTPPERRALLAQHPGVTYLKTAVQCEAWKPQSLKQICEGTKILCRNAAHWRFRPLEQGEPMNLCMTHLLNWGIYGNPDEEARTNRWLKRKGLLP